MEEYRVIVKRVINIESAMPLTKEQLIEQAVEQLEDLGETLGLRDLYVYEPQQKETKEAWVKKTR